jgi:hypothetical protein
MSYKNYISICAENKEIVNIYEMKEHPYENITYGIHFLDNKFSGKKVSVKTHSFENQIYYIFSDTPFSSINFKIGEDEISGKEMVYFYPKNNSKIIFHEDKYLELDRDLESGNYLEYFKIGLKNGAFSRKNSTILEEWETLYFENIYIYCCRTDSFHFH